MWVIQQRILCCRKFIIIYGSSDLFIEQLLALAECQLLKFSFRAWQKYCILSSLSLGRFSKGILINISSKKNAFVRVFALTIRHFETGLFERPGKSDSARPPRIKRQSSQKRSTGFRTRHNFCLLDLIFLSSILLSILISKLQLEWGNCLFYCDPQQKF